MSDNNEGLNKVIDGKPCLMNPEDGQYYPIIDEREKFSSIGKESLKGPEELAFERAFEERRKQQAAYAASEDGQPVPGGVGYGSFFNSQYKNYYQNGTVIALDIICPQRAGGNVNTWLYLTETNRTAKGVEALVYYYGQWEFGFKVYDWAREDHWQVSMSEDSLRDYLKVRQLGGYNLQTLRLQNVTCTVWPTQDNLWCNLVYMYNYKMNAYSLIYSYDYETTEKIQKGDWIGSWGPIVETFQDSYNGTNLLGFADTYTRERNWADGWSQFHRLTDDKSYIRNDRKGFQVEFLNPNYSFAVR